ncbi:nucleotide-binding protein [Mycolicibacterium sp. XJ870]
MAEEAESGQDQESWPPSALSPDDVTTVFVRSGADRVQSLPGPPAGWSTPIADAGRQATYSPSQNGFAPTSSDRRGGAALPPPPGADDANVRAAQGPPRRHHPGPVNLAGGSPPPLSEGWHSAGSPAAIRPNTAGGSDNDYRRSAPIQAATAGLHAELVTVSQDEQSPRAMTGWRGTLNGMGLRLGPSVKERRHRDLVRRIRAPKNAMYAVAVLTLKGGAGKTTVSSTLGQVFASLRPDGVLAVDVDPAAGDLDTRTAIHPEHHTMLDLLNASDLSQRDFVQRYLSTTDTNLHVLTGGWRADSDRVLVPEDIRDVHEIASHYYSLLIWDGGTDLHTPVSRELLNKSDALVLLIPPTRSGALAAAKTIDWLRFHGHEGLLSRTVLLINESSARPQMRIAELQKFFVRQQIKMHHIAYDQHLDEGVAVDLTKLSRRTRRAFEEMAAVLADDFLIPQPPAQPSAKD